MIMLLFGLVADTSFGLWSTPFPSRRRRTVDRELTGRQVQPGMRPSPRFDRYLIARWNDPRILNHQHHGTFKCAGPVSDSLRHDESRAWRQFHRPVFQIY